MRGKEDDSRRCSPLLQRTQNEGTMKSYRLCFVRPEGRIDTTYEITCADDFDALAEAERAADDHMIEVWDGSRLVVRLLPGTGLIGRSAPLRRSLLIERRS